MWITTTHGCLQRGIQKGHGEDVECRRRPVFFRSVHCSGAHNDHLCLLPLEKAPTVAHAGNFSSWCHWVHSVFLLKRRVERILIECPAFGCATESNTDYQECDVFVTAEKFHAETLSDVLGKMWSLSRLYCAPTRMSISGIRKINGVSDVRSRRGEQDVWNQAEERERWLSRPYTASKSSTVACISR